jgi:starch phosphorylase
MRLLVDEHGLDWNQAWTITGATFAYTNHTLLPEALEKWPVDLFGTLLPRHLEIVFEINRRFLDGVRAAFPDDECRVARLSLIDESGARYVRMAHLACVGSHTINGVAQLHSELLKQTVLCDFAELWPEKFCNVTNGVTPRRFVAVSNPGLTQLITERIGDGWPRDLDRLRQLEPLADDAEFQRQWRGQVRQQAPACSAHCRAYSALSSTGSLRRAGEAHPNISGNILHASHPHALSAPATRS